MNITSNFYYIIRTKPNLNIRTSLKYNFGDNFLYFLCRPSIYFAESNNTLTI